MRLKDKVAIITGPPNSAPTGKYHCQESVSTNVIKYASRILLIIATVAKFSCKHGLWLIAHINRTAADL